MSNSIEVAHKALIKAANSVRGLRGFSGDESGKWQLPAVIVGIPVLRWEAYCEDPTSGVFPVTIVVPLNDKAIYALMGHVGPVTKAIEDAGIGTVQEARPVAFEIQQGDAAGYELSVECPLT